MARHWYDLTDSTSATAPLKFPFKTLVPWLNQTTEANEFYYSVDPFESRYLLILLTITKVIKTRFAPNLLKNFKNLPFTTNEEYVAFYEAWNQGIQVN